jgi:hypothetical protein
MDLLLGIEFPSVKYNLAVNYLEKHYKSELIKKIDSRYKTNNLVESWWNLMKTKFKTARSLSIKHLDFWFNLFVLRYHFNHLGFDGTILVTNKRFKNINYPDIKSVINSVETEFKDFVKQHNFTRS